MNLDFNAFNKIVDTLPILEEDKNKVKEGTIEIGKFYKHLESKLELSKKHMETLIKLQLGLRMKNKMNDIEFEKLMEEKFKNEEGAGISHIIAESFSDFAREQNYEQFAILQQSVYDIVYFMISLGMPFNE